MEFSGQQLIPAPRALVWQKLNDMAVIKDCIAGCESVTEIGPDHHELVMVAAVGPVKAKFKGKLAISEKMEGESYKLAGEGNGGIAGFGKMTALVSLADAEGGTTLTYKADATVGGKLAQIGSRLVQAAANKFADDFFKKFNEVVSLGAPTVALPEEVAASAALDKPLPVNAVKNESTSASSASAAQESWWQRFLRALGLSK